MMVLFVTQKVCMRKREGERRRGGLLREQYLLSCAMVHGGLVGTGIEKVANGVMVVV